MVALSPDLLDVIRINTRNLASQYLLLALSGGHVLTILRVPSENRDKEDERIRVIL